MTVIDDAVAEVMCETRDLRKGQRYPSHKGEGNSTSSQSTHMALRSRPGERSQRS